MRLKKQTRKAKARRGEGVVWGLGGGGGGGGGLCFGFLVCGCWVLVGGGGGGWGGVFFCVLWGEGRPKCERRE